MMRRSLMLLTGTVAALLLAATADAQTRTLSMSGEWWQNRGPLVDIPINGGPVGCAPSIPDGCTGLKPMFGGIQATAGGAATGMAPKAAGATAFFPIPVTGASPAGFSVNNSSAFTQVGGAANRQTAAVAGIPTVIQLQSQFSLMGPGLVTTTGGNGGGTMASFKANNWSVDPQQAARLAANFTWCPPAGVCLTAGLGTYGDYGAKFTYTAGANAFGGTMAMMLRDTAVVSIALPTPAGAVLHQLVGGTTNPTFGPQMGGNKYFAHRSLVLANGPVHATFMTSTPCTSGIGLPPSPAGCDIITAQGPLIFSLPGSANKDWGMPWTTGTVKIKNLAAGPNDPATTFTAMGTDSRTVLGRGQITMVAGQTSERNPSGNHFSALDIVVLNFKSSPTVPLASWPALVGMLAVVVGVGMAAFNRRAAQSS